MPTSSPFGLDQFCTPLVQFFVQLWYFISYLGIPLPIGIIGGWRWGVWLLRRFIGMWYRPLEPNGYTATTAVVTPVYNEDPALFRAALRSWAANRPNQIIAVIDHTDQRCMEQFKEFEAECAGSALNLQMLITHTPGKRPALADGILAATSDIVFLVDSDTIWDPDLMPKALAPFIEPEVGGVTMRQRVWHPHSTAQRIFDVYLDIRYIDEIRYLTAFGDAVTCLSGRTAVYRRFVALTALEDLMEETFWGRRVISGDDKALTLAVQSRGWKVRYQESACVYTPGATVMKVFLKQRLRWARNSWRADLKAVGSRWTWHKPFLIFHLLDRLLQPLTTLVAPLYLGFSLFQGNWKAAGFLISWWLISRSIKIWPHLRQQWTNIRILPWYVFFNYWSAVMKIYAFFTMNQQGWITRWSRSGKAGAWVQSLQSVPSYAATTVTVGLMALFIHSLHEAPVRAAPLSASEPAGQVTRQAVQPSSLAIRWTNLLAVTAVAQCKTPWFEALPTPLSPQVVLAQSFTSAPATNPAAAAPYANELCVLEGKAKGLCSSYQIAPAEAAITSPVTYGGEQPLPSAGLSQTLQYWWPVEQRLVTITGPAESPQLCLLSSKEQTACTGYTLTLPPSWRQWWNTSGAGSRLNEFLRTFGALPAQTTLPIAEPANNLCVLQGESEGLCTPYHVH